MKSTSRPGRGRPEVLKIKNPHYCLAKSQNPHKLLASIWPTWPKNYEVGRPPPPPQKNYEEGVRSALAIQYEISN